MGLYTLMKTGQISFTLTRVVYTSWLVAEKTCHLTDYFLWGNFANCEQWQTTSLCELILTAWLKKVILKYVPECWKWCLRENKISTFFSSACPWILLGGAWCNASVFQLNTPSVQITHLSHFLMTTLLCWIKITSKRQLFTPKKKFMM